MVERRLELRWRVLHSIAIVLALAVGVLAAMARPDVPVSDLVTKYGGGASRFVDLEGMRVHYRDEGSGPPLVLIHGTSSSLHTWDGWTERLASRRRIVRMDLPGFGLTGPAPDRDYTAARYARIVVSLMDRLDIDRADVAGNSLGGRVAATMALDHPTRVRRLILIDAAGLSGHTPARIFRLAKVPVLNRTLTLVTPRFLVAKNVREVYGDEARLTDEVVDRYWMLTRREGNRSALVDRLTGPQDPVLDDRLREIDVPVLVQWGERDRWIPLAFGQRFATGIRGATLITYPDAGHVPMEEIPDATARDAAAFLVKD